MRNRFHFVLSDCGIHVCDIGSGNGTMIFHLARQFPKSVFTGIDMSSDLMEIALATKSRENITNVSFHLQDATELPQSWYNTFDYVMIRDVLHDIAYVTKALKSIYKCLKPGGIMSIFEINMSRNPYDSLQDPSQKTLGKIVYAISMYQCLPASLFYPDSEGLGAGSGVETITQMVTDAGFQKVGEPNKPDWANVHLMFTK
jgi:ubiquinone/menaquinone biosynthesis C-methylase UbiE